MLVVGEDAAELLHPLLLVFAFDDRAFVDADADGILFALQAGSHRGPGAGSLDIAGLRRILWTPASMASSARWK